MPSTTSLPAFHSDRLKGMVQSDIRRMTRECRRVDGINLGQGVCELPTHQALIDGAIAAIQADHSTYTLAEGIIELREAIAVKLQRDNNLTADPESNLVVTHGATGAFATTVQALLNPGDGILFLEPSYGYHVNMARIAGMECQFATLRAPNFDFDAERLEASITPNTRALVICTPANPSGKIFTRTEIEAVAELARKHNLLIITDEIYEYITHDGREHLSPATVEDLWDRTISIMGLSKTYSVTGWRLGYIVARQEFCEAITLVNDLNYVCVASPLQYAAVEGLKIDPSYYAEMREDYSKKRQRFCGALEEAGLKPIWPQGAYYTLTDITAAGFDDSHKAAMSILEEGGVAGVPGRAFYQGADKAEGRKLIRFCFAVEWDVLEDACERLIKWGKGR